MTRRITAWTLAAALLLLFPPLLSSSRAEEPRISRGQTLYVPVYSNVYSAPRAVPFRLATMLSLRNTDMAHSIRITAADLYDNGGKLLKRHYLRPLLLAPLASAHIYISEKDATAGFGANFIVRWSAEKEVNAPIIECVMIGARSGQGISFVSPGRVIREGTP